MARLARRLWCAVMLFALFTAGCALADKQAVQESFRQVWGKVDIRKIFRDALEIFEVHGVTDWFCSFVEDMKNILENCKLSC